MYVLVIMLSTLEKYELVILSTSPMHKNYLFQLINALCMILEIKILILRS
jgi:hypothetical protein